MELLFDRTDFKLYWDKDLAAIYNISQGYYADEAVYKADAEQIIAMLTRYRARRYLSDSRKLQVVSLELQAWTETDWFPRAIQAGLRSVAVVIPESALAQMSIRRVLRHVADQLFELAYFSDLAEARAWLAGQAQ